MRVNFIRHAESVANAAPGVLALPGDDADRLSEKGFEQARAAAEHLSRLGATRILCSSMNRARQTAETIGEVLDLPVMELADMHELRESDGYADLPAAEQRARLWSAWMSEHAEDRDYSWLGGESFSEMVGRVVSVKQALVEAGDPNVLAVSHGNFLRFFHVHSLLGDALSPAHSVALWQLATVNCGHSIFDYNEVGPTALAREPWRCVTWMSRPWARTPLRPPG